MVVISIGPPHFGENGVVLAFSVTQCAALKACPRPINVPPHLPPVDLCSISKAQGYSPNFAFCPPIILP